MRSRINGLNQAMSSIDDGISLTNVGEGALAEVHDMLHRMQTLAVEAANITRQVSNTMLSQANAIPDMIIKIHWLCELKDDGLI